MLSSNGISWRQGPHQLAQKFSITTWPLYCARLTSAPLRELRENDGAAAPGAVASAGSDRSTVAATAAMRILMLVSLVSEKHGRADDCHDVVGELRAAEQAGLKDPILHRDMYRQPVCRYHTVTGAEVRRELRVPGEIGATDAAENIKGARHGVAATEEDLARQEVVAQRKIVVREAPLRTGKQLNTAQGLETGLAGLRAAGVGLEEHILGHVVGGSDAVHRVGAEVFDTEHAELEPELQVAAAHLGYRDLTARDLRLDDPRRRGVVRRRLIHGAGTAAAGARRAVMEPAAHRGAAGQSS